MNMIKNTNINFKSLIPFYYPRGKNVDRAEILAREAEWRQMVDSKDEETSDDSEETSDIYYGARLSDKELEDKLREADFLRSQVKIDPYVPADDKKDETPKQAMPVFQTEETLPKTNGKLDIRG